MTYITSICTKRMASENNALTKAFNTFRGCVRQLVKAMLLCGDEDEDCDTNTDYFDVHRVARRAESVWQAGGQNCCIMQHNIIHNYVVVSYAFMTYFYSKNLLCMARSVERENSRFFFREDDQTWWTY